MIKKLFSLIILVALVGGIGYLAMGPKRLMGQIEAAILADETEKLNDYIDFPILRQNIKDQFSNKFSNDSVEEEDENPITDILGGLASKVADKLVDAFVTPKGVADIMKRHAPQTKEGEELALFPGARYAYESINQCSVYVPSNDSKERQIILERRGIDWVVINLMVDAEDIPKP